MMAVFSARAVLTFGRAYKLGSSGKRTKERTMLVLSRKKNESIVINDDITIVVVEIRGDKVRLGVEAPKEVPVHRREVFDAIHRNEAAAGEKAVTKADTAGDSGKE
jgi:carbon storage regulator